MIFVTQQDPVVKSVLGCQDVADLKYRWSQYVITRETYGGSLLYNTLTCEMLFMTDSEQKEAMTDSELIRRWFLFPEGYDDHSLAKKVRSIRQLVYKADARKEKERSIDRFWILTTTGCNARCFYCHEHGIPEMSMTQDTAERVIEYIGENDRTGNVHIMWYGGEPLINQGVIDHISGKLREQGFTYTSSMISNGFLFDETTSKKAADLWHLNEVQITLDGLEETYNRVKAYKYETEESPFLRVLNNIAALLDAEVRVKVRLNIDRYNKQELFDLSELLIDRFRGHQGFSIYTAPLMETCLGTKNDRTEQQRREVYEAHYQLSEKLRSEGVLHRTELPKVLRSEMRCIAVSDVRVIFPDGQLAFCHDYSDGILSGNIFGNDPAREERLEYTKCLPEKEECGTCARYPQCVRFVKCFNNQCNKEIINEWKWVTMNEMLWEYEKMISKKEEGSSNDQ